MGTIRFPVNCGQALKRALQEVADEVCTPGSRLHRLATKN